VSHGPTVGGFLLIAVPAGVAAAAAWVCWPVLARRWQARRAAACRPPAGPGPQDGAGTLTVDEQAAGALLAALEEEPKR
jgi:hypothetical protein